MNQMEKYIKSLFKLKREEIRRTLNKPIKRHRNNLFK